MLLLEGFFVYGKRSLLSPRSARRGQTALYFAAARQEGLDVEQELIIIAGWIGDTLVTWMDTWVIGMGVLA